MVHVMHMRNCFYLIGIFWGGLCLQPLHAQDTLKKKNIDITSSFKPSVREASKIPFAAAPLPSFSTKEVLTYQSSIIFQLPTYISFFDTANTFQ